MNEQIDIGTVNNCKNLSESYGEICVKCNKCERFDQEKQIEEMAEVLENAKIEAHATIGSMNNGFGVWYAQALYNEGYRKQSEVVDANNATPTSEWEHINGNEHICKNCSTTFYGFVDDFNFCPYCGAKMKGGAE